MTSQRTMSDALDSITRFYADTHTPDAVELYNRWRRLNNNLVTDVRERSTIFDFCHSLVKMDPCTVSAMLH